MDESKPKDVCYCGRHKVAYFPGCPLCALDMAKPAKKPKSLLKMIIDRIAGGGMA